MNLKLVLLSPQSPDLPYFQQVNEEAFPPYERMTFAGMFSFSSVADLDILGIYDGDSPVGFTVLMKNDRCGYIYFLAIGKEHRSKGYGSAALQALFSRYHSLQIILDFEELDPKAENYHQRVRRKDFYLRNGLFETGRFTRLEGNYFEVVCNKLPLREDSFKELLQVIHAYVPEFSDQLFTK